VLLPPASRRLADAPAIGRDAGKYVAMAPYRAGALHGDHLAGIHMSEARGATVSCTRYTLTVKTLSTGGSCGPASIRARGRVVFVVVSRAGERAAFTCLIRYPELVTPAANPGACGS